MRSPCPWFLLRRVSPDQTRQGTPTHRRHAEDAEIVVPKALSGATLGGRSGRSSVRLRSTDAGARRARWQLALMALADPVALLTTAATAVRRRQCPRGCC